MGAIFAIFFVVFLICALILAGLRLVMLGVDTIPHGKGKGVFIIAAGAGLFAFSVFVCVPHSSDMMITIATYLS